MKSLLKITAYLIIAFVVVSIWKDPHGSAATASTYMASVGHFFRILGQKLGEFVQSL